MDVEFVGQYHSFGRYTSDVHISVHPYRDNAFCVCVSYCGDNSVLLYEVQYRDELKDRESDAKRRKHFDSTSKHYSYEHRYQFAFLESHVLPFPIYFLVSTEGSIWAVSHSAYAELTFGVLEGSCNTGMEFSVDQSLDASSHEPIGSGECKRNSVCCVSKFSSGILMCRENFLQNCWTVEIVRRAKKPVILFSIPFATSRIHDRDYSPKYLSSRGTPCALKHVPILCCIEVETEANQGKENVLKKNIFMAFFGFSLSSNAVVLIGFPDGNVLWQFMDQSDAYTSAHEEREFHLLCNIEQPVRCISTQLHVGIDEASSIIVIGVYGKVMILSTGEISNNCANEIIASSHFAVNVFHIPSPVYEISVCHQGLLHTGLDGQLWVSTLSYEKTVSPNTLCEANIMLNFQQLSYYGVKHIVVLNHQKGVVMCVGSNGSVHIGNFFRTKVVDQGITEEEVPLLLKSISLYGTQLQELQVLAQKQRKLFAAVATAAKIKLQGDHKLSISCKIMEVFSDVRKFLIIIEFQNLKYFNLDHELWILNGSISSVQEERITVTQGTPLSQGSSCITVEMNASLFSNSIFPLLVEGGLLLNIPTEWKSLGCFENVVPNLPLYVKIQTVMVNEFYILQHSDSLKWSETSMNEFEQCRYKSIFTALQKIAETKSSYGYFKAGLLVKDCNQSNLPQEFSIPVLVSSAQSILNHGVCSPAESPDLLEKMIQYLLRRSNIAVLTSTNNFVCLNNPVSISVKRKGDLICVTLHSSSFPLLVGLKISLIHALKEANHVESREKNISISSKLHGTLQALSLQISQLLCRQRNYVTQEDLEVYKKLREDISNNVHIL